MEFALCESNSSLCPTLWEGCESTFQIRGFNLVLIGIPHGYGSHIDMGVWIGGLMVSFFEHPDARGGL